MLFSSASYALAKKPLGLLFLLGILLVGLVVYWLSDERGREKGSIRPES
jgi:hypothetical protein